MSNPLETVFSTGSGLYAANSIVNDKSIAPGKIRLLFARIDVYDIEAKTGTEFDEMSFMLLAALAQGRPDIARALITLHETLAANLPLLKHEAQK